MIPIDDDVMEELKRQAVVLGLVFSTPSEVLRKILELKKNEISISGNFVDIEVKTAYSAKKWYLIPLPKKNRRFFPGYNLPFYLETDIGEIKTHVTSALRGTPVGDPDAGTCIQSRLYRWFKKHNDEIKDGTVLRIQAIELGKRYKLDIKK